MIVRPGRPPSEETRSAILAATIALLCEVGYPATTMDAIAERAGSSKATIYRHWPNKPELVVAALTDHIQPVQAEFTGDLRRDLVVLVEGLIAQITGSCLGDVIGTIADAAERDPQLNAVMTQFRDCRREPSLKLLTAAREHGALRSGLDLDLVSQLLVSPIFFRLLIAREPVQPALAEQIVDILLPGLRGEG